MAMTNTKSKRKIMLDASVILSLNKKRYIRPKKQGIIATLQATNHFVNMISQDAPIFLLRTSILRIINETLANVNEKAIPRTPNLAPQ